MSERSIIDIHVHWCLFGRDHGTVRTELEWLEEQGYEAVALFPLPGMGASPERILDLIPGVYRERIGLDLARAQHDDLVSWRAFEATWRSRQRELRLLSFLDVRAWDGVVDLTPWWGSGHAGLKGILIEEADGLKMAMPPLRHIQNLSPEAYRGAQRAVFGAAARYGVPLIYHADLSLHGAFVAECLEEHPGVRVNIPHCGFSRRAMIRLFERFPLLVTDLSSLGPQLAASPGTYRSFVLDHPDRILLGSDMIASHDLRPALEYVQAVQRLGLPEAVEAAVLGGNARRFLAEPG